MSLRNKKNYEFNRINTSDSLSSNSQGLTRVVNYLEHVCMGNNGLPYCPFVNKVHNGNGYYVALIKNDPKKIIFENIVKEMISQFFEISPNSTCKSQEIDITTIVSAFTHDLALSHKFGLKLENERNKNRNFVLEKGLMLSQMYPFHSDPNGGKRYISAIPLLMIRRMHEQDIVFMTNKDEMKLYLNFFGNN